MRSARVHDCRVVGAALSWHSSACFQRCDLVVDAPSLGVARVAGYPVGPSGGVPTVDLRDPYRPEDWRALVAAGDAAQIYARDLGLTSRAALWAIRLDSGLPSPVACGAPGLHVLDLPHVRGWVIVEGPASDAVRDGWAESAAQTAEDWIRCRSTAYVVEAARRVLALERELSPRATALLACAYQVEGRDGRARAWLEQARQRGPDFAANVSAECARLTGA